MRPEGDNRSRRMRIIAISASIGAVAVAVAGPCLLALVRLSMAID